MTGDMPIAYSLSKTFFSFRKLGFWPANLTLSERYPEEFSACWKLLNEFPKSGLALNLVDTTNSKNKF